MCEDSEALPLLDVQLDKHLIVLVLQLPHHIVLQVLDHSLPEVLAELLGLVKFVTDLKKDPKIDN